MLKLYDTGVYLLNGREIVTDAGEAARKAAAAASSSSARLPTSTRSYPRAASSRA